MQPTYKKIENSDIDSVALMMHEFYAIDGYPIDVDIAKQLCSEFISNEALGRGWLIVVDSEIVGYLILTFVFSFEYAGKIAFLDELYVKSQMRGHGIGKAAVEFVKTQVAGLNLKVLYLEVEPHNQIAQNLYLSAGFEMHKRHLLRYRKK